MSDYVTIHGDVVIKTGRPELMRIEVEKTLRAHEIAESCGLFQVPKVLDYDASTGQAKFELIRGIQKIREVITSEKASKSIMETIGQSLAIIHKDLKLPESMVVPLPQEYCLPGSEVFLHGDLGLGNICVNTNSHRIVIFDWQTTRKLEGWATYGSRYFDLMWFVYNLFYRPFNRPRYKIDTPAAPMAEAFLCSYFEASDCSYDHKQFSSYMKRFLNTKLAIRRRGRHWKRRILLIPSHMKLRRFTNSFYFNQIVLNKS